MRIAVCDDEKEILDMMQENLTDFGKSNHIDILLHLFTTGESLLKTVDEYDLIFLDIEMPGIDGIQVAKEIRRTNHHSRIVYISSHAECVMQSFAVHPFDYILKPVTKEQLEERLPDYLNYMKDSFSREEKKIELQGERNRFFLPIREICLFEYIANRKIKVYENEECHIVKGSLYKIMESFENEQIFASPHKSFIVNMMYIEKIKGFTIFLTNGRTIPIAQKRYNEFCDVFSSFIGKHIMQR